MKLPPRPVAALLVAAAGLAPPAGAARLAQEAQFHPRHHGGHHVGRAHHGHARARATLAEAAAPAEAAVPPEAPALPAAAPAAAGARAASALQAPRAPAERAAPPAPAERGAPRGAPQAPPRVAAEDEAVLPAAAVPAEEAPTGGWAGSTQLPAVSSMLGSAAETLKQISSQAGILEARVVQTQEENEARISRQKAVFEQKLKEQAQESKAIEAVNTGISREIGSLKKENLETEKHAKELQSTNRMMRVELSTLKAKLAVSREFLTASLLSTDDSKALELDILQDAQAKKQREEHQAGGSGATARESHDAEAREDDDAAEEDEPEAEDAQDDDEGEARGTSFLALSSSTVATGGSIVRADGGEEASDIAEAADRPASDPRDLLKVLSTGVDSLEKEEKESESRLKALFLASFRDGTQRRKALLLQQGQLNATRATLLDYRAKLQAADGHLQRTRGELEHRLHAVGAFLQRLAAAALAPPAAADRQLRDLPAAVAAPDGPADGAAGPAAP